MEEEERAISFGDLKMWRLFAQGVYSEFIGEK